MQNSAFDPDTLMASATAEVGSTKFEPVPPGEYLAQIDTVAVRVPKDNPCLDVNYNLLDDALRATIGREKVVVRQTVWLDLNASGGLDMGKGKNIGLNRIREALDLNKPGQPFSMNQLKGAGPLRVTVTNRPDKDDPTTIYNDIKTVGKA